MVECNAARYDPQEGFGLRHHPPSSNNDKNSQDIFFPLKNPADPIVFPLAACV
jgi:hypothetical protein